MSLGDQGGIMQSSSITLFHAPNTRSTGVLILLEELGIAYQLQALNLKRRQQRRRAYRLINPMRKVPALKHGNALITEQVAILLYLADLFPAAGLAPPTGDVLRGPYLRWMVFYASCFEPAMIDRWQQREPAPYEMSPYGDVETTCKILTERLNEGPYILGSKFSAADVLWATALTWIMPLKLLPNSALIEAYTARVNKRPAVIRARAKDAELGAAQDLNP